MDLKALAVQTAGKYGLPVDLFLNQIQTESAWNPRAVSSAGARGLLQIMPATGADLGLKTEADFFDPAKNLDAGARYMVQLVGMVKSKASWLDPAAIYRLALVAYNGGIGYVYKAIAKTGTGAPVATIIGNLIGTGIRVLDVVSYANKIMGIPGGSGPGGSSVKSEIVPGSTSPERPINDLNGSSGGGVSWWVLFLILILAVVVVWFL